MRLNLKASYDPTNGCTLGQLELASILDFQAKYTVVSREAGEMTMQSIAVAITALLGVGTVLTCTWKYLNSWRFIRPLKLDVSGQRLPPGSLGWPFLGEMRDFLKCFKTEKPDVFIGTRVERYGKGGLYTSHMFGAPSVLVTTPEVLKFVLKRDDLFGPGWPSLRTIMGTTSVVTVTGALHKSLRRYLFDAVASPEGMRKALPCLDATVQKNLKQWAEEGTINLRDSTKKLTFYIIAQSFLSLKPSPELELIEKDYNGFMAGIRAFPLYVPGTAHYTAVNCRRRLAVKFQGFINNRKITKEYHEDFLQSLMDARDPDGLPLPVEVLTDNIFALTLAGYESSAYTMLWTLILLEKHPQVLAKLREEHRRIKERVGEAPLTLEDTKDMKYTQNVIDETLRMVNIAPFLFRTALQDVDFKGYRLPKGWKVLPWLRAPHMDPEYFPQPEMFNPDRWDDKDTRLEAFNPFGGGARTCVGNQFAKLLVSLFLHHAAVEYKWKLLNPSAKIQYLPHPKPVDGGPAKFTTL